MNSNMLNEQPNGWLHGQQYGNVKANPELANSRTNRLENRVEWACGANKRMQH